MITFQEFKDLIEVIVWPCTLLLVIFIYRTDFSNAFKRLGSLKADATGISLTFDHKIESVKELAKAVQSKVIAKDGASIAPSSSKNIHYDKLIELRGQLDNKLVKIAENNTISPNGLAGHKLLDKLTETGSITIQQARLIDAIYDLMDSATTSITKKQVNEITALYQTIPG